MRPGCGQKKSLRGDSPGRLRCLEDGSPGELGPEGSTRTAPRRRCTAPRWQRVRRKAVLVQGSCQSLQRRRVENKRPGGLRPTGSFGTPEAEPPELDSSTKSIQRNQGATHPPRQRGSWIRLARSGVASSKSRAFGRQPQCRRANNLKARRLTPPSRWSNGRVARTLQRLRRLRVGRFARVRLSSRDTAASGLLLLTGFMLDEP